MNYDCVDEAAFSARPANAHAGRIELNQTAAHSNAHRSSSRLHKSLHASRSVNGIDLAHHHWLKTELARESLRADTAALNLAQLLEDKQKLTERVQQLETELKQLRDAASRADAWESGVERLLNRIDGKERQQQLRQQMQQQKQQQRQQQEMQAARDRLQQQDSQLSSFKQQLQDKQTELEASSAAAAVAWEVYEGLVQQLVPLIAKASGAVELLHCSNINWLDGSGDCREYKAGVLQGAKTLAALAQLPHVIKQHLDAKTAAQATDGLNSTPAAAAAAAAPEAAGAGGDANAAADAPAVDTRATARSAAGAAAARIAVQSMVEATAAVELTVGASQQQHASSQVASAGSKQVMRMAGSSAATGAAVNCTTAPSLDNKGRKPSSQPALGVGSPRLKGQTSPRLKGSKSRAGYARSPA